MRVSTILLPQTTIGIDTRTPNVTSTMEPWEAPATAMTLSRLITASATTMVLMAAASVVPPSMESWPSSSPCSISLMPIQNSSTAPTIFR